MGDTLWTRGALKIDTASESRLSWQKSSSLGQVSDSITFWSDKLKNPWPKALYHCLEWLANESTLGKTFPKQLVYNRALGLQNSLLNRIITLKVLPQRQQSKNKFASSAIKIETLASPSTAPWKTIPFLSKCNLIKVISIKLTVEKEMPEASSHITQAPKPIIRNLISLFLPASKNQNKAIAMLATNQ